MMPLSASIQLSATSITPPQATYATLALTNTGALGLSVSNVEFHVTPTGSLTRSTGVPSSVVPIGPGVNTFVPAGGSLNIGPFPVVAPNLGNSSTFYQLGTPPVNVQGAMPPVESYTVGALVYASDGTSAEATPSVFLCSFVPPPPPGTQGGSLVFSLPSNSPGLMPGWP